jgi:ABC-2 type transport system permease protein
MSAGTIIWIVVAALIVARLAWRFTKKGKPTETNATPAKPKKSLSPNQRKLFTIYTFVKINTRRYFRDRTAIFFTIAFPLIFLFIFGGLFGHNSSVNFKVALLNESNAPYSQQLVKKLEGNSAISVNKTITTMSQANDQMAHGTIDATIVLPQGFGEVQQGSKNPSGNATVYYTENSAEAAQTLTSLLQAAFVGVNAQFVKTETPFTVASKQTGKAGLTQFDYTFSGLLGFSILGLGIFGPVNTFPELKKQGVLRRFHTTPIRVWQFFMANVVTQALIGLITMVVMFGVAIAVFHLKVVGNYAELAVFLALSIGMIFGIGLAVGGWAQNERQAAPLVNIITFPMMFLSGTFFPRYLMPEFLQRITNYLPLTPVIDGARLIATEGKGLLDLGPQLGIMGIWLIVIYAIAFRVFRWE